MFYRRQPDAPLPNNRTFIVNLADGTSLRIWASSQMVTVYQHRKLHEEPLWRATFDIADNPELARLYSERLGWDIVGLISLMRSEIVKMLKLDLRDTAVREELGLSTVSAQSHHRSKQQKRSMGEAIELIGSYVEAHPGCTRLDIARGLDRAKSPHLIVQIEWLVTHKVIVREHVIRANGTVEYRYRYSKALLDAMRDIQFLKVTRALRPDLESEVNEALDTLRRDLGVTTNMSQKTVQR